MPQLTSGGGACQPTPDGLSPISQPTKPEAGEAFGDSLLRWHQEATGLGRPKYRWSRLWPLVQSSPCQTATLSTTEMVRRFDRKRSRIWEASASKEREFWVI
jgi:hypothetical protein